MGTWCGPDDPGNSHEPRSWRELAAMLTSPTRARRLPGRQAEQEAEKELEAG